MLQPEDFAALLSPAAAPFLEQMAQRAQAETRKHFGNSVQMFTPLYIANYCENYCIYCGFNCHNKIRRAKLDMDEIEQELKAIAATGLQEILMLTGESRSMSPVSYIGEAVKLARKYFRVIGIEIYPLNVDEYAYLHECGVDYVTVFQETYDADKYKTLHLGGHKRIFPYRLNAQERALMGGMRAWASQRFWACPTSARTHLRPVCTRISSSASIRTRRSRSPARACARSSTTIRLTPRMCTSRS